MLGRLQRLIGTVRSILRQEGPRGLLQRIGQRYQRQLSRVQDRGAEIALSTAESSSHSMPAPGLSMDPYSIWLRKHLAERQRLPLNSAPMGRFSLLTYVYERSPANYFRVTAESVLGQTTRHWEWVLLAQGEIPADLQAVIDEVARDPRVKLLREPANLGIIRAARRCLDAAEGEYVLPLDGDDVLTNDALAVLQQALIAHNNPEFLYTDEDVLVDERPQWPYLRPDWDPVLNLASSYAWHSLAYRRETALRLGVYRDAGAEYCQDWDTISRFADAGIEPVHVPQVTYHWRAHPQSSTNKADPNRGSLASQRYIVARAIARQPRPELYEIQSFPIFRGGDEWWIQRRPIDPPTLATIWLQSEDDGTSAPATGSAEVEPALRRFPGCECIPGDTIAARGLSGLRAAAIKSADDYTMVCSSGLTPEGNDWPWEAIRLFEFHPRVAFIAGRVINPDGVIIGGGELFGYAQEWGCPEYARLPNEPGPWAFLLKQRCVDAVNGHWFIARTRILRQALASLSADVDLRLLGIWLGAWSSRQGHLIATTPLMTARARPMLEVSQPARGPAAEALRQQFPGLWSGSRWYSPALSDQPGQAYELRAA